MVAPDTSVAPLTLWLSDRSRWEVGISRCPRARHLTYHEGDTGYGWTPKRESLPLATGLSAHEGSEAFAQILKAGRLPTLQEVRGIVAAVCARYVEKVAARGYQSILGSAQTDETITEQQTLIAGLLWVLYLKFLPWLHANYQVVAVEEERLHFLHCTCGAPPLDADEHVRRGCAGRALMLRTDLLARRRGGQSLAQFEMKTTGYEGATWSEQWETKVQLALSTLDTEPRYGAEVSEQYIVTFCKGRRQKDKYDPSERKKQLSPLCYGYCRPGNPPLANDDWLPGWEWIDANGETKRASRTHKRRGVWELETSDWPVYKAYREQDPGLTPVEFWVRWLPPSVLDKICFVLGPMNRQDAQLQSLRRSIDAEEARWQQILWDLYEVKAAGHGWATPEYQAALDRLVPCSWNCRPFGKEHQCAYVGVCHRHSGWEDPIGSGRYVPRLPHHTPERDQAIARGLIPAEAAETDDDDANT